MTMSTFYSSSPSAAHSSPELYGASPGPAGGPERGGHVPVCGHREPCAVGVLDEGGLADANVPEQHVRRNPDRWPGGVADSRCPAGGRGLLRVFGAECGRIGDESGVFAGEALFRQFIQTKIISTS